MLSLKLLLWLITIVGLLPVILLAIGCLAIGLTSPPLEPVQRGSSPVWTRHDSYVYVAGLAPM